MARAAPRLAQNQRPARLFAAVDAGVKRAFGASASSERPWLCYLPPLGAGT
jgi:hypothetical protein